MRKSAGFTLIELVIVIVILGILGAVAAPRFINMQGDAYEANVKALNGSIQSAMTLANTKAILGGYDKNGVSTGELSDVNFVAGFPAATASGIIKMLQDTDSFTTDGENSAYAISDVAAGTNGAAPSTKGLKITPSARKNASCSVTYYEAKAAGDNSYEPARTVVDVTDC